MTKITNQVLAEQLNGIKTNLDLRDKIDKERHEQITIHFEKINGKVGRNTAFIDRMKGGLKVIASSAVLITLITIVNMLL